MCRVRMRRAAETQEYALRESVPSAGAKSVIQVATALI
jgi:hypothetical protein